jgi:hypothetical protein
VARDLRARADAQATRWPATSRLRPENSGEASRRAGKYPGAPDMGAPNLPGGSRCAMASRKTEKKVDVLALIGDDMAVDRRQ